MPTRVGGDTRNGSVIVGDGDFVLDTRDLVEPAYMRPPVEVVKAADDWRPAEMMRRVCAPMAKADKPLTQNGVLDRVKGKAGITRRALAILIDEHYVEVENGPNRSKLHRLIKMYDGDPE